MTDMSDWNPSQTAGEINAALRECTNDERVNELHAANAPGWYESLVSAAALLTAGSPARYVSQMRDGLMSTIVVLTDVSLITGTVDERSGQLESSVVPLSGLTRIRATRVPDTFPAMPGDDGVQIVLRFAEGTEVALPLTEAPSRHNQRLLLSESARLIRLVNNTAT